MSEKLLQYVKKKDFLVCVDSDGCAIDSMDIKHIVSFGPCMVKEWGLEKYEKEILDRWNEINLYTLTRGINRFKGLNQALHEINEKYSPIDGVEVLDDFVTNSKELSNVALIKFMETNDHPILKKALSWSKAVNETIENIDKAKITPFEGVLEGLKYAHQYADVAIVSSANNEAVVDEWSRYHLLEHTDIVMAQNYGSKAYCISKLLEKGYDLDKVIMVGDAMGDLDAANKNGVAFYPILVKKEKFSWTRFVEEVLVRIMNSTYLGEYQEKIIQEFKDNFNQK